MIRFLGQTYIKFRAWLPSISWGNFSETDLLISNVSLAHEIAQSVGKFMNFPAFHDVKIRFPLIS